ncbi:hypothetical protein A2635_03300 [Candidatus Peribacteria bacterium RIFCSPHIGHO2_01_FULL_51_9]|nr:MAG: hypothetical protein A2635_03300 [Candidatus Peribacteria bacterium RIFCSPHIGHO2_01_FULL_51_9]
MYWVLAAAFLGSLLFLLIFFYRASSILVPATGGTYIEGSVGELRPLNPWFAVTNDVNRDIVSLVFAGLLKYNPQTKEIEDDLATVTVSADGRVYTATLKESVYWHDSNEDDPHPVTADDILFTFKIVQDPQFPNSLLRQNFQGIGIEKINERTVQFRLEEPYGFFRSNLTLGLLPKRSFEGIPSAKLDQALDFGFSPIGAGPYRFKSIVQTDLSSEVTLERFERDLPPLHRLDRVVFRIFSDFTTLLSDLRSLDGVRLVPRNENGEPIIPQRFQARNYTLPQYVALFFNLDRPFLQDRNLRLGLQLGTNKQAIIGSIHEAVIVDTPLLELDVSDWRYQFDPALAQGALFESNWHLPEKIRLQRLLEKNEANASGILHIDPIVLLDTGAVLTITGTLVSVGERGTVNDMPIQVHPDNSQWWTVALPTHGGTGSIMLGENLIRLRNTKGNVIDSFYLWRTSDTREYRRASEEQRLLELFLYSKAQAIPLHERISVSDLFLDHGFLRRRTDNDTVDIRMNDEGKRLELTLLTSPSPLVYEKIAEVIQSHWRQLGVAVKVEIPDTREAFEDRLFRRDYDILLFGQSLLDNLDSYPYWHSSGVQKQTENRGELKLDAYNLSQYTSFATDALLEVIRGTTREGERQESLKKLREVIKNDVPAIFLYSPLYTFAHKDELLGVELGDLSLHSDRFLTLHRWYTQQKRTFKTGRGWLSFIGWIVNLFGEEHTIKESE